MVIYKTTNLVNGKWYIGKDSRNKPSYLGSGKALKKAFMKYGKENFKKEILQHCTSLEELAKTEEMWIAKTNAVEDSMSYNLAPGGENPKRCYGEENHNYGKIPKAVEHTRKPVVCLSNNISYISISEAARALGVNISHVSAVCNMQRKQTNGLVFRFVGQEKLQFPKKTYNNKKIINVDTGEIYDSAKMACKQLNRSNSGNIGLAIKTGKKAYGFHWEFLNE